MTIHLGDCIEAMRSMESESVDAVVTDPPYNLAFMGKHWDAHPQPAAFMDWCREWGAEALRVTKPGGYLLAFGGTRTHHRLVCGLEDAGWEIRDMLSWIYASGFPKSLDVSKALDKVAGAEREVVGRRTDGRYAYGFTEEAKKALGATVASESESGFSGEMGVITAPATDLARKWEGWGTALKPAHEPIVMARKPLVGTVAANVTRYGTGALNIDGTRIGSDTILSRKDGGFGANFHDDNWQPDPLTPYQPHAGRWPSNVLLDPEHPELFDEPNPYVVGSGATASYNEATPWRTDGEGVSDRVAYQEGFGAPVRRAGEVREAYGDRGGYSRFFLIPSRYNGTCVRCGRVTTAGPTSYQLSPSADTAPIGVATSPDGMPDSTVRDTKATTGAATTTIETEESSSNAAAESMPSIPRSKRRGTSPASTPPSSPARLPDAVVPATATTTITPSRYLCATCADAITSSGTSSTAPGFEPPNYPTAFIVPKAGRAERERGLTNAVEREQNGSPVRNARCLRCGKVQFAAADRRCICAEPNWIASSQRANSHPTVKPVDLMRHLVRLVTPAGGVVLDPFAGSGSTLIACELEGFEWVGIEKEPEYVEIAKARLNGVQRGLGLIA